VRLSLPLVLVAVAAVPTAVAAVVTTARAAEARHPAEASARVRRLRAAADHYRTVTWAYDRAARRPVRPTAFTYRHSTDGAYLQWTADAWQRHAYRARVAALHALRRRLGLTLPVGPGLHAALSRRLRYVRTLARKLRGIYPGPPTRGLAAARGPSGVALLREWELRAAEAAVAVSRHASRLMLAGPRWLTDAFLCIHRYEAGWDANTGNGYYGGLQMDVSFMRHYGPEFLRRFGTADRWPVWAQVTAGVRAYRSGRGFWPWPNTAHLCGLL
jgi:hypothetical protein